MAVNLLHWTIPDLEVMPDDGGWKPYEVIEGERYVTPAPHLFYQGSHSNIHFEWNPGLDKRNLASHSKTQALFSLPSMQSSQM